ncbi:GNAT family N-acetyltransferase [Mesobacterium sp. TK19101]|uniref:GNAT family N-acetyltransferase n=1 Tax=Mesobacterium hydrothermale TaxID=3111907 RepID=A0ABU6HHQ6_9RHOB|nr:GNAT family N-acetyltransferase [Mesobacterium sp. TK19101]MEC3861990.1 GNAT family N-acetyltransferase [Mesobacterium sp. TK19101]
MTVTLRQAAPLDAGAVGAILSGFVDDTPWMPRIHTRAEELAHADDLIGRGWVTVAEQAGDVVGFIARAGHAIHALYLVPRMQGQGIGTALLRTAQRQAPRLELWTFQANDGAQRFYHRHGFRAVEQTDGAGNDEGLPDIRFIWERQPS